MSHREVLGGGIVVKREADNVRNGAYVDGDEVG